MTSNSQEERPFSDFIELTNQQGQTRCVPNLPPCNVTFIILLPPCSTTRRPIAASFTRQITQRETNSVMEEIRRKKERETAGAVSGCDRAWPFADAKGTFSGGSHGEALC
ncbi:unnamed protein product [Pleuronectes platessa]|uniref:Uncharacterized protein n=1 Tax=Pleuronectes platessa TaxID=8262 RepID=A0A9N7U8D3_PLEPL|nr:unnamed protein product [Pleuronectes platessa]